jgi:hypothetical protein
MSYTLEKLQGIIEKDGAKLDQSFLTSHLTSKSRIAFTCKCGTHHSKLFISLFRGGANCDACTREASRNSQIETRRKMGQFIYDKSNLLELIKVANAILVTKIPEKLNQRDQIEYICQCGKSAKWCYFTLRDRGGAYCEECIKKGYGNREKKKAELKIRDETLHPDKLRCSCCRKLKSKTQFGNRQKTCNKCHERSVDSADSIDDFILELKKEKGSCVDCGEANVNVLQFDHIDHLDRETKTASVSRLVSGNYSKQTIDTEISKCRLICANCHRLHTIKQLGFLDNEFIPKGEARKLRKELNATLDKIIQIHERDDP